MLTTEQVGAIVAEYLRAVKPYYKDGQVKPIEKGSNRWLRANEKTAWPEYWTGYNESIKERDSLRVHIEAGVFPAHLVHSRSPNQTQAEFDYARANFKQVTLPHFTDLRNLIARALSRGNWAIEYKEEGGDLQYYLENQIGEIGSIVEFAKGLLIQIQQLDPNGIICTMPERLPLVEGEDEEGEPIMVLDDAERVEPRPIYFPVERVVGKQVGRYFLLLTTMKSEVEKGGKKEMTGQVLWLVDDQNCWEVRQVGKAHELKFETTLYFNHETGYVPCISLMGTPIIAADGSLRYQSHYLPARDLFDLVLLDSLYLFMAKSNSAYPYRVMLGHECEYVDRKMNRCVGGNLLGISEDGESLNLGKCPECSGTGVAARLGPNGVLFVKDRKRGEGEGTTRVQDAMTFVEPAANTLDLLRREMTANTQEGRRMLHLFSEQPIAGGDAATATEVGVGVKAQQSFIKSIADQIFGVLDFTIDAIARQRYGQEGAVEAYTLIPATSFDLRTEVDYLRDLKTAIDGGLPPSVVEEIMRGYIHMRYGSDPWMREAFEAIALADRLFTLRWDAIAVLLGRGEVSAADVALHSEALSLYERKMQEPEFRNLDTIGRADALKAYADELYGTAAPVVSPVLEIVQQTEPV